MSELNYIWKSSNEMTKCNCNVEISDTKSLKKYLRIIGNNYFDQYAEDGLEEYIKFEMCIIYLYNKYRGNNLYIKPDEYNAVVHLIKECTNQYKKTLREKDKESFELGCRSQYEYYREQKYIKENKSTNFAPPTGISLVSIVYFILRMFLLDWIKDAKLNQNKIYVPISFALSVLLLSVATTLILHTVGLSYLPFLKGVSIPAGVNIITFLPIHFSIAIVLVLVSTAFLGLGVNKLNNAKTVESTIDLVFSKVENNLLDNSCIDCNYSRLHRRLVPILASVSVALIFVAFIFEVQAHLQSNNPNLLGISYLNRIPFSLHLGTFLSMTIALGFSLFSIYKYKNKEYKRMIQSNIVEYKDTCKVVDVSEKKDYKNNNENEQDSNFLGQNLAKLLILCKLPEACIKNFKAYDIIS